MTLKTRNSDFPTPPNQRLGPCGCAIVEHAYVPCAAHLPEWKAHLQEFADRIDARIADEVYQEFYGKIGP